MSALLTKPHFFKPLLPGFEDEFLIPAAFFKYLEGQECEKAMLGSRRKGKFWPVKVNGRQFGDGWKQFVQDHDLQIGDFLVFRHEGDMVFYVLVFGRTTCEREYPPFAAREEEQIEIHEQIVPNYSDSGKKIKTGLEAKASSSILEHPYCVIRLTECTFKSGRVCIPSKFAREHDLYGRCSMMILKDEEGNCWPAKLDYKSSDHKTFIAGGWTDFHTVHKLKTGDSLIVELTRNGKIPVLKMRRLQAHPEVKLEVTDQSNAQADSSSPGHVHPSTEASNLEKSQLKTPEEVAKESDSWKSIENNQPETPSGAKASSSVVQQRFFVAKVTSLSNSCYNSKLYIPAKIVKQHFQNKIYRKVILIDREGKSWPGNLRHKDSDDQFYIAEGWNEFCLANNLKAGDSFVFEFIKKEKRPAFKMYDFKANHKARKNQEAASSSIQKPCFYVTVQSSDVKNGRIRIPTEFALMNGIVASKCSQMTIENEMGNSWQAAIKRDKNGEIFIGYGWSEFADGNGIKEGDVFMLELVKGGATPLMHYYAPKQQMDSNQKGMCEDLEDVKPII